MTFAAPLFLIAALAGIIPVVLHLISRRKAKQLPFSTLRFLQLAARKTRRRRRIHDLLLMLLRAAVLMLIAAGLARPTITNLDLLWGSGSNAAVALILDNSASMGVIDGDCPRLETAKRAARQILDELADGDQVALLTTGGPRFAEEAHLDRAHEKVVQMLDQCRASYERADLGVKLQEAQAMLAEAEAANKQIYVLTDLQELSFESLDRQDRNADEEQSEHGGQARNTPVIFVDCHRAPKPNVAVTGVSAAAPVPLAGVPVSVSMELLNTAAADQQRHVELLIDGVKEASSPVLNVPAGSRLKHDFQITFHRGGLRRGEVRLVGDDGSVMDDRRFFSMTVDRGIPVAVVRPRRHEIPYLEDSFYLEQALAPGRSGEGGILTTGLVAGDLLAEPLDNYKVIFCVNLPAVDTDVAVRLRAYVAGGGNLVWICGDNVDVEAYNQMNQQAGEELLPAALAEVRAAEPAGGRDSWNVAFLDKKHAALGQLVEPASLYQSILVYKHVRLSTTGADALQVLARLDDGEPLLVERSVGRGKLLMLATAGNVDWSNLPLRPIFLPLLIRLTFDLAGAEQQGQMLLARQPLILPLDDRRQDVAVEVLPPSGETIRLNVEEDHGGDGRFRYDQTHQIGIYRLQLLGVGRGRQVAYAVNGDGDESDPKKITREELQKRLGGGPLIFADNPDDLSGTFAWLREGKSLWELFLAGVLIALVFETFLSNRFTPKQEVPVSIESFNP